MDRWAAAKTRIQALEEEHVLQSDRIQTLEKDKSFQPITPKTLGDLRAFFESCKRVDIGIRTRKEMNKANQWHLKVVKDTQRATEASEKKFLKAARGTEKKLRQAGKVLTLLTGTKKGKKKKKK